jgi:SAM-dependent methyltransferase
VDAAGYDVLGTGYARARRADPRIGARIRAALEGARSVVDVGAGTGSYEPAGTVLAVEPSRTMIDQRPAGLAPAVMAVAEALPLADDSVDAALASLTVHHWSDLTAGIAELRRVARTPVVVLTFDPEVTRDYWLWDYLPPEAVAAARSEPPLDRLVALLPGAAVEAVPIPHDCLDGFAAAYWRRPRAYLDPRVRAGTSVLARHPESILAPGLRRLAEDLESGAWHRRHRDLLDLDELDAGYRLVVASP